MKSIIGIILIVIGVLVYLFFKNYHGELFSYPILWFFAGITLIWLGFYLIRKSKSESNQKVKDSYKKTISKLKECGLKIPVEFRDCEIIANKYYQEIAKSKNLKIQAWDSLYDPGSNVKIEEVNQSRISYQDKAKNEQIFISPIIYKDEITLSFILEKHIGTSIYIDKNNPKVYYFDLEFLK